MPEPQESTNTSETSSIEEVPRIDEFPTAPPLPGLRTISLGKTFVNITPWKHFVGFAFLAAIDLAMNAGAAAAAATVGASLNQKVTTPQILRVAALAGMTKSAITTFREVVGMMKVNFAFRISTLLLFSSFGIALVVTAQVCDEVLGEVPSKLLVAAVVTAIPLLFEAVRQIEPKPDENGHTSKISRPIQAVFLIPMDALAGYVFARMASNQDMPISAYHAAAAAGAVFGTLTWLARIMTGICVCIQRRRDDKIYTIFGTYKLVDIEITVTDDEINKMQEVAENAFKQVTKRVNQIEDLVEKRMINRA